MTVRKIIRGEQIFTKADSAQKIDLQVGQDLQDTLLANKDKAVGLAANMIGINKKIISILIGPFPITMFEPMIIKYEEPYIAKEGCLSLDGERIIPRFKKITVEYYDFNFRYRVREFTGSVAEAIQHEVDHTEGKII